MTGLHTSGASVTCPTCSAEPGRPCTTVHKGIRMSYFHSERATAQRAADEAATNTTAQQVAPAPPNESPIFLGTDSIRVELSVAPAAGTAPPPQRWGVRYSVPHHRDEFEEALWARQLGEEVRKIALQELARLRQERE